MTKTFKSPRYSSPHAAPLENAESDEQLQRVIKDAAKYGVDWSRYA